MNSEKKDTIQVVHKLLKTIFILVALGVIIFFLVHSSMSKNRLEKETFINNKITLTPEEIAEKEKNLKEWDNQKVKMTPEQIRQKEELLKQPLNQ